MRPAQPFMFGGSSERRANPAMRERHDKIVSLGGWRPLAMSLVALGLAATVGGCAPTAARLSARSPLAISSVWTSPETRVNPLTVAPRVPQAVVLRWNAHDYSPAEIRNLATQQCLAYDLLAWPSGVPSGAVNDRRERFICALAIAQSEGPTRG